MYYHSSNFGNSLVSSDNFQGIVNSGAWSQLYIEFCLPWVFFLNHRRKKGQWKLEQTTKKMLAQRIDGQDTLCHLCGAREETDVYFFFECLVAKAIWFGCSWSLQSNRVHINTSEEIVKLVLWGPFCMSIARQVLCSPWQKMLSLVADQDIGSHIELKAGSQECKGKYPYYNVKELEIF